MQLIFMDRKGRAAARQLRDSNKRIALAEALVESEASEESEPTEVPDASEEPETAESQDAAEVPETVEEAPASDRDILMEQTMALYRQRRAEYEKLDEGVRTKMTKLATDQFGDKKP